jgi:hypothetical protein
MEITITKTILEKVQLELPAYFKNLAHVYKISADETCIQVCTVDDYFSIGKCHHSLPMVTNSEPTTKEFYNQEYKKVLELLKLENLKK